MSKIYRIKVGAELLCLHDDKLILPITLAGILPDQLMKDLLAEQLRKDGWQENIDDGSFELQPENNDAGAAYKIDGDMQNIEVTGTILTERTVGIYEEYIPQEYLAKLKAGETVSLADLGMEDRARKEQDISEGKLNSLVIQARRQINRSLAEVYKKAILEKASSLGTVESVQENKNEMGTRISIKVKG